MPVPGNATTSKVPVSETVGGIVDVIIKLLCRLNGPAAVDIFLHPLFVINCTLLSNVDVPDTITL